MTSQMYIFPGTRDNLQECITALLTCGHAHWFAVKLGDPTLSMEVSEVAMTCIQERLDTLIKEQGLDLTKDSPS